MLHFENDYNEGVHPALLEALVATNEENLAGYDMDSYPSEHRRRLPKPVTVPMRKWSF